MDIEDSPYHQTQCGVGPLEKLDHGESFRFGNQERDELKNKEESQSHGGVIERMVQVQFPGSVFTIHISGDVGLHGGRTSFDGLES
ncbi:uncharacterized protein G2W53_039387 [Senna tora]|uniref:Uncharacterized protein n=1 Tax=Senna tora TaxID=362788 RepID=A0A834SPG3_9FABA|nr:uncharacterized protein G2W53_039387 [Senna tora]